MKIAIFVLACVVLVVVFSQLGELAYVTLARTDWAKYYHPGASNLSDPYAAAALVYPVWMFVALYPLALFPTAVGYGILTLVSVLTLSLYVKSWWRTVLLILTTPVLTVLFYGQIDVLQVWAFTLPIWGMLIVVATKPMVLGGWAARKFVANGNWKAALPLVGLVLVSFAVWGFWPVRMTMAEVATDASLAFGWPWWIPVGLVLLVATKNESLWLVGSLFLTPYLCWYHLVPVLAYFYKRAHPAVLVIVMLATWVSSYYGVW